MPSMLASGYGRLDHGAMIALKEAIDEITLGHSTFASPARLARMLKDRPDIA